MADSDTGSPRWVAWTVLTGLITAYAVMLLFLFYEFRYIDRKHHDMNYWILELCHRTCDNTRRTGIPCQVCPERPGLYEPSDPDR